MMIYHGMMMGAGGIASWNIDTAVYAGKSYSIPSPNLTPQGMMISPDGTKLYLSDGQGGAGYCRIYQYTFGIPFDASTLSYASKYFSTQAQITSNFLRDSKLSSDGTKMYAVDGVGTIFQYTLSTAWDISTASYASKSLTTTSQDTAPWGIIFSPDGLTLFVNGLQNSRIYQYTLSTAWDISTATYASKSYLYSAQDSQMTGMWLSPDGKKLYGIGPNTTKRVYQYSLSTAYDISTCSYASKSFLFSGQTSAPSGLAISPDGLKMFMNGAGTSQSVWQYTLK
jgi:sugar lactone lactonase YvrE